MQSIESMATDFNTTKSLRHALYGVYYAFTAALPPESADKAKQVLRGFLSDPDLSPEERVVYETLTEDSEPRKERPRPQLRLITGGAA